MAKQNNNAKISITQCVTHAVATLISLLSKDLFSQIEISEYLRVTQANYLKVNESNSCVWFVSYYFIKNRVSCEY